MRMVIWTLTFPNRDVLIARASANSAVQIATVEYSGDVEPKPLPEKGTLGFLEWYFRGLAVNRNAEIAVRHTGEYEAGLKFSPMPPERAKGERLPASESRRVQGESG